MVDQFLVAASHLEQGFQLSIVFAQPTGLIRLERDGSIFILRQLQPLQQLRADGQKIRVFFKPRLDTCRRQLA